MTVQLGAITKVDLREVWPHEALDFTKWLAQEKSLSALGQTIGIELEPMETESKVGSFHVDLLATELGGGRKVIIENQLEETDHDHLGKIITYAAGKEAQVVIWIVAKARDEHRKAIEWLNEHTDPETAFFLIQIELISVDGSLPAPMFNMVESPNDWLKSTKEESELGPTQLLQLEYWRAYREAALADPVFSAQFRPQKPHGQHWATLSLGSSKYHLNLQCHIQKSRVGVELYIEDKELGQKVLEFQQLFEEAAGCPAETFEAKKSIGLRFFKNHCSIKKKDRWPECIAWQLQVAQAVKQTLAELGL